MDSTVGKTFIITLLLLVICAMQGNAQAYHCDTLELKVFFKRDIHSVDPSYRGNAERLESFRNELNKLLADSSAVVRYIAIRTSASPEGGTSHNQSLSEARAKSINRYLTQELSLDPYLFRFEPVGEDWEGLERILSLLNSPPEWVPKALDIIRNKTHRKERLKKLDGGKPWAWMDENIFPELRAGGGSATCVIQRPAKEIISHTDTVFVPYPVKEMQTDTIIIQSETPREKKRKDFTGRKFLLAARTNILAVPLANVGIEIPLGRHWSIGADWYYPWIWRDDTHRTCNELLAIDIEARYWFGSRKAHENSRLLGHSIGAYAAAGYYDFERNWFGHQGEFINVGVDWLYSCPIFKGTMHLELELGLGYIYSQAQPYDCFVAGGKCYRRKGVMKHIQWAGPTRAQISLAIPIYSKRKGGGE